MTYVVLGADGSLLHAHLDIDGHDVLFHSRGGKKGTPTIRNQQYGPALRLVLERLAAAGEPIVGAWVDSSETTHLAEAERLILSGSELTGSPDSQFSTLSRNMRRVGRSPDSGYGGSTTKRIRLRVATRSGQALADVLQVKREDSPGSDGAPANASTSPLVPVTDLKAIDDALGEWLAALEAAARPVTPTRRWLAEDAVMLSAGPSDQRDGALNVALGVRASGAPWTVQINAPRHAADVNALTTVATDPDGARFLLRQGRLQANPDSAGPIGEAQFRAGSGLTPVAVSDVLESRDWYVVAPLDASTEEIRRRTAEFVHGCARARAASLGHSAPAAVEALLGADEKGGAFFRKPTAAKGEQEVRRLQGEVWLELRRRLDAAGIVMTKPRHVGGYEVDGLIHATEPAILLEIKTGTSAADVYEGVGQLMIYTRLLNLTDCRRMLLLPREAPQVLLDAAADCGVQVHHFEDRSGPAGVDIRLSDEFLEACGALKLT